MRKEDASEERIQSAYRMRKIRENARLTQEKFSEILGISLSAYKKIESGENQVSISSLRKLYEEMNVSADYVLFGEKKNLDGTWEAVLNCTEYDKMCLMMRLLVYFTETKKSIFPLKGEQAEENEEILQLLQNMQDNGED